VHYDDALNYGGLGVIVAHELTHAFDDQGRESDAQGTLRDWWEPSDAGAWDVRESCVRHEFARVGENDKLVTDEALADLGGVEVAYGALGRALGHKHHARIEGWTPQQRFFLAFAQTYASYELPQRSHVDEFVDPHPEGRERILQTLENVPEFAAAFGCRAGEAMVRPPAQRCTLW
jgi:putative endopeptidase